MTASVAVRSRTRFTTVLGGCGIIVGGILSLATTASFLTLVTSGPFWFSAGPTLSAIIVVFAQIILAVAVYILGFGVRAEAGLVGSSRTGKTAVVIFSSALILGSLIRLSFIGFPPQMTVSLAHGSGYVLLGLGAVALACLIVAVIVVIRRGTLNRVVRWGLVIVTAWTALTAALWFLPIAAVAHFAFDAQTVAILLQIVLGAAIALHGQAPALRHRAAVINEHW